ncbi:hypothetical protein [Hoeflea ulvae]|uniref:Uncharacterized protein n=1 Tax=Hoeflea ulvae TaxID=2983764 RepID=A0ABT3YFP4_9HYPH|nr:hypothetical protein [Hoeflea ulvae]MCY0094487.1 hypothetical protein [Hoeflea ulvae]
MNTRPLEFAMDRRHIIIVALKPGSAFFGSTQMSHSASPSPANFSGGSPAALPKSRFVAFLTAVGAIVLISSEIWLAAIATIWAADGLLDLAAMGDMVLIALIGPLAIWATYMTAKLAISAEMNPENAD